MKTKLIMKWAAAATLACITLTTVNAEIELVTDPIVKDTSWSVESQNGSTINATQTNGQYTVLAGTGTILGNSLSVGLGKTTTGQIYRAFDNDQVITLGSLVKGESITLKFNFTVPTAESGNFIFGFIGMSDSTAPVYAYENINGTGGIVRSNNTTGMGTTNNGLANSSWTSDPLTGNTAHDIAFIVAAEGAGKYSIKIIVDTTNTVLDIPSSAAVSLYSGLTSTNITGISFRDVMGVNLNSVQVDFTHYKDIAVPEPSTWMLLGSGIALLAFLRRRK